MYIIIVFSKYSKVLTKFSISGDWFELYNLCQVISYLRVLSAGSSHLAGAPKSAESYLDQQRVALPRPNTLSKPSLTPVIQSLNEESGGNH